VNFIDSLQCTLNTKVPSTPNRAVTNRFKNIFIYITRGSPSNNAVGAVRSCSRNASMYDPQSPRSRGLGTYNSLIKRVHLWCTCNMSIVGIPRFVASCTWNRSVQVRSCPGNHGRSSVHFVGQSLEYLHPCSQSESQSTTWSNHLRTCKPSWIYYTSTESSVREIPPAKRQYDIS